MNVGSPARSTHECNYLQANEGNHDPIHARFPHLTADSPTWVEGGIDPRGIVEAEETEFGVRVCRLTTPTRDL